MAALLECVNELQDHVREIDPSFSPPYRYFGPSPTPSPCILSSVDDIHRWMPRISRALSLIAPFRGRIEDDRIEDLSVKLQFNTYEKWTKALKYMLTDIKWLVASRIQ